MHAGIMHGNMRQIHPKKNFDNEFFYDIKQLDKMGVENIGEEKLEQNSN